jgi:hypothetical protein
MGITTKVKANAFKIIGSTPMINFCHKDTKNNTLCCCIGNFPANVQFIAALF